MTASAAATTNTNAPAKINAGSTCTSAIACSRVYVTPAPTRNTSTIDQGVMRSNHPNAHASQRARHDVIAASSAANMTASLSVGTTINVPTSSTLSSHVL